jgi:hypothetical protein
VDLQHPWRSRFHTLSGADRQSAFSVSLIVAPSTILNSCLNIRKLLREQCPFTTKKDPESHSDPILGTGEGASKYTNTTPVGGTQRKTALVMEISIMAISLETSGPSKGEVQIQFFSLSECGLIMCYCWAAYDPCYSGRILERVPAYPAKVSLWTLVKSILAVHSTAALYHPYSVPCSYCLPPLSGLRSRVC